MKKIFILLLTVAMALMLSSCNKSEEKTDSQPPGNPAATTVTQDKKTESIPDFGLKYGMDSQAVVDAMTAQGFTAYKDYSNGYPVEHGYMGYTLFFTGNCEVLGRQSSSVMVDQWAGEYNYNGIQIYYLFNGEAGVGISPDNIGLPHLDNVKDAYQHIYDSCVKMFGEPQAVGTFYYGNITEYSPDDPYGRYIWQKDGRTYVLSKIKNYADDPGTENEGFEFMMSITEGH